MMVVGRYKWHVFGQWSIVDDDVVVVGQFGHDELIVYIFDRCDK